MCYYMVTTYQIIFECMEIILRLLFFLNPENETIFGKFGQSANSSKKSIKKVRNDIFALHTNVKKPKKIKWWLQSDNPFNLTLTGAESLWKIAKNSGVTVFFNRQPESKHYSTQRVEYGRNGSARAA